MLFASPAGMGKRGTILMVIAIAAASCGVNDPAIQPLMGAKAESPIGCFGLTDRAEPDEYFSNPEEAALARRIWHRSLVNPPKTMDFLFRALDFAAWAPWANRRLVAAAYLANIYRWECFDRSAIRIASNVEHFFVTAMLSNLGHILGAAVATVTAAGWELIVGRINSVRQDQSIDQAMRRLMHDLKQFATADIRGVWFGLTFGDLDCS